MTREETIEQLCSLIADRKSLAEDDEKADSILLKDIEALQISIQTIINSDMGDNLKHDANKPRLALVPPELIEAVGEVRTFGVQKYGDSESWKMVETYRYKDAMMRHLVAYLKDSKSVDEESGLSHLWHLACNVAFLIALERVG